MKKEERITTSQGYLKVERHLKHAPSITTYPKKERKSFWSFMRWFSEREDRENKRVEEIIRKKDEKSLGNWLKDFGRGKGLWYPKEDKMAKAPYSREQWVRDYGRKGDVLEKDNF